MTRIRLAGLAVACLALLLDQVTKQTALVSLSGEPVQVAGFLNLRVGFNEGISFGLFAELLSGRPLALAAAMSTIAAALLIWLWRTRQGLEAIALGAIVGGAFGNVADRLRHGAVVDFLDFHVGGYHWPAFNFADAAIVSGTFLLVFASIRSTSFARR